MLALLILAAMMTSQSEPAQRPDAPGHTTPEAVIATGGAGEIALANMEEQDTEQSPLRWAQGLVWYQIFPDRFRNGNPKNDSKDPTTYVKAWTSDWYAVDPDEKAAWEKRDAQVGYRHRAAPAGGDTYRWIFDRRYGGDLQGVVEKLDYLKDLGVTAIYFNPIFQSRSMHKYDASDHRHVDENFGWPAEAGEPKAVWEPDASETTDPKTWKWTPADRYFIDVVLPECRKRGLKVILDGVWNHTGRYNFAFQDVMRNGKFSAYADWFIIEWDESGEKVKSWKGWDALNGWLPEFRKTAEGDLAPGPKEYVFGVTRRWMDPNGDGDPSDGIDGWRLDVVPYVPAPFWKDWNALVKQVNPKAITIAEIWQDKDNLPQGKYFDTQMNYPFAFCMLDWLTGVDAKGSKVGSEDLVARLEKEFGKKPLETRLIAQNLFDSHDTDRYVQMLWNPGRNYDQNNSAMHGSKGYKTGRPPEEMFKLSLVGVAIQTAFPGSPMVYYGNELGAWGEDDPDDRKPMSWADLGPMANAADSPDPAIHAEYKRWLTMRADPVMGPALKYGTIEYVKTGSADVFAFKRVYKGTTVLFVANRGKSEFDATRLGGGVVGAVDAGVWVVK